MRAAVNHWDVGTDTSWQFGKTHVGVDVGEESARRPGSGLACVNIIWMFGKYTFKISTDGCSIHIYIYIYIYMFIYMYIYIY